MVEFTSIEVLIPIIVGIAGFLIYIITVYMNMRIISENKMGGTLLGKLLSRLGIAWILSGITSVIIGVAYVMELEYNVIIVSFMIVIWWIGAILVLDAIRKWKKEMK